MPYIKRQSSIIGKGDACSAGMKKAGLVPTSDFSRVPGSYLKKNTVTKMPTFALVCCGTRGESHGHGRIVHGRPVPIG